MGGGDLNTKKSWHPNTMKNQERVWKAEQAAANEKKRINDLRREMDLEKSKEDLLMIGMNSGVLKESSDKLDWMYKGPHETVDREEYLLGKSVDKNFTKLSAEGTQASSSLALKKNHVEHECIPFSIRNFRGDSLGSKEIQVDMARKMMEDPLAAIKKREIESRAQLLQNPVKLKELTRLLREDQEKKKRKKEKKKKKKRDDNLDLKLAEKLKLLKAKDNFDIDSLLTSKDKFYKPKSTHKKKHENIVMKSSDDSESEDERSSNKKSKKHHSREKKDKNKDYSDHKIINKNDKRTKNEHHSKHTSQHSDETESEDEGSSKHYTKKHKGKKEKKRSNKHELHGMRNKKNETSSESSDEDDSKDEGYSNKRSQKHESKEQQSKITDNSKHADDSHHKMYKIKYNEDDQHPNKKNKNKYLPSQYSTKRRSSYELDEEIIPKKLYRKQNIGEEHNSHNYRDHSGKESKYEKYKTEGHDESERKKFRQVGDFNNKKDNETWRKPERQNLSQQERKEKLKQMMDDAAKRDKERENNIARYREQDKKQDSRDKVGEFDKTFVEKQLRKTAHFGSVESRIKANINNIQRSRRDMDSNFAKR